MAQRGKRLDEWMQRRIRQLAALLSVRRAALEAGVSTSTVWKYRKKISKKGIELRYAFLID